MTELSRRSLIGLAAGAGLCAGLPATAFAKTQAWDDETDVLVAGGGAAGCMAAVEAAKAGRRVLIAQATPMLGGSSAISSGWIRCTGTQWHEARKVKDSPEAFVKDMIDYGRGCRLEKKVEVIARESTAFVNYLAGIGVRFTDEEDRANGGEALRIVKTEGGGGALMRALAGAVEKTAGVKILKSTKIVELITNPERTEVLGAVLERRGGKKVRVKASAVVLATGGYGRNQALVERFTNSWAGTGRIMDIEDKGKGLELATDLGAGTANLNIAMVCPTLEVTKNIFYSSAPLLNGAIIVNENGRRFTNEYVIYTQTNLDMLKQKTCWEIVTPELATVLQNMDDCVSICLL